MTSPTQLENFAAYLLQEVLARTGDSATADFREECFLEHVLELLDEHNEISGAELLRPPYRAPSLGRLPAAKLNGWSLSGDGATLDLYVVHYGDDAQIEEIGLPETRKHFAFARGFLKRAIEGFHTKMEESTDAFLAAQQIHDAGDSLATVRFFFITDGVVRSMQLEEDQFPGMEIRYVVWDLDKLSRLRVGQREAIELDFVNDYGGAIPCLQTAAATGEYRTFLAYFPAPLLARIYGEHGQRLLERNVRAFLQARGKVNRGLQKTLKDEPHRFLAYNNGLCCTASEVKVKAGQDGHARLESAKDFQIVNGGQTTASIYHALKKGKIDVSQVMVQVKLTVLSDPEKVSEIVPLISLYANSQNKVNTADFSANGGFHHALEQLSRTVWAPAASGLERGTHWYYERARGSYADDKARQGTGKPQRDWEAQNPLSQKFTKTDLAKYEHSWLGMPDLVCFGAEKNFNRYAEWLAENGEPSVDQNHFKSLVSKAILFRTAEKLFTSLNLVGLRAQSVAYAVAWLAVKSEWRIDVERIWEEQRLSPALCEALKLVCAAAHNHITSQPGNQSEASKREACWKAFKQMDIPIGEAWKYELAATRYLPPNSEEELLSHQWEVVRHQFSVDGRTMAELEALTGKSWITTRRTDLVQEYASYPWDQLRNIRGLGIRKLRGLVELLTAAAGITSGGRPDNVATSAEPSLPVTPEANGDDRDKLLSVLRKERDALGTWILEMKTKISGHRVRKLLADLIRENAVIEVRAGTAPRYKIAPGR